MSIGCRQLDFLWIYKSTLSLYFSSKNERWEQGKLYDGSHWLKMYDAEHVDCQETNYSSIKN